MYLARLLGPLGDPGDADRQRAAGRRRPRVRGRADARPGDRGPPRTCRKPLPPTTARPVTRTLWVVRHAKAVADPPTGGADHDRPLAPRGRRDAEALGRRLAGDRLGLDEADVPDVVLCSTARRTRQTADGLLAALAEPPDVDYRRALYYAGPDDVVAEVRTVPDDVGR